MIKFITSLVINDKGSALIVSLLILAAVTIIGISALNTSNVELLLANNDLLYKRNFYLAEAVTMQGAQELENASKDKMIPENDGTYSSGDVDWLNSVNTEWGCETINMAGGYKEDTEIVVIEKILPGSSIDLTKDSMLHAFSVYGKYDPGNGSTRIEIGYKRRY